jgi:hypothetical protein
MSKEEVFAALLELSEPEQRELMDRLEGKWAGEEVDPDMTPELRAKLAERLRDMEENPDDEMTLEEVEAELDRRDAERRMGKQ